MRTSSRSFASRSDSGSSKRNGATSPAGARPWAMRRRGPPGRSRRTLPAGSTASWTTPRPWTRGRRVADGGAVRADAVGRPDLDPAGLAGRAAAPRGRAEGDRQRTLDPGTVRRRGLRRLRDGEGPGAVVRARSMAADVAPRGLRRRRGAGLRHAVRGADGGHERPRRGLVPATHRSPASPRSPRATRARWQWPRCAPRSTRSGRRGTGAPPGPHLPLRAPPPRRRGTASCRAPSTGSCTRGPLTGSTATARWGRRRGG